MNAKSIKELVPVYPSHKLSRENEIFLHPAWRHNADDTWTLNPRWKLVGWSPSPPIATRGKDKPHAIVYEKVSPDDIPGILASDEREGFIFQGTHVWVHGNAETMRFRQPTQDELNEAGPWLGIPTTIR